ncbi:MAG: DUF2244 domain-containing protein [Alphaproteobacteria bacterium]|nr:DUF2244 domain-containing protein [Alphaproteobacteria bacterium]
MTVVSAASAAPAPPVLLDAILRPNPPMSARGLLIILAVVAAINIAIATTFVLHGAWPIMPFLGLDVGGLAWAFVHSSRAAKRYERVTLTPASLDILSQPVKGQPVRFALNPYWVRVEMDDPPEPWSQITLWSHGNAYRIGTFLSYLDRSSFAHALKSSLLRARGVAY